MFKKRYTSAVGQKFNPDGSPREFPGNSVICHIPRPSKIFKLLLSVRHQAEAQPWARKFSFLPSSSYHMTVFDGVCEQVREPAHWTSRLPLDAPIEQVDGLLVGAWQKVQKLQAIQMHYHQFYALGGFIGLYVVSANPTVEQELRDFRDRLADAFGIRHPNHSEYAFHITLAYGIEKLNFFEKWRAMLFNRRMHRWLRYEFGTLNLNAPELTFFADMTCFAPIRPPFPPPESYYED